MEITWKIKGEPGVSLASRQMVPNRKISALVVGFGFSTTQEKGSPHYHADETAAATVMEELQRAVDAVIAENLPLDIPAVDLHISKSLDRANQKLIHFGNMIACGVYAGGCVFYCEDDLYICVPFGGAYVYSWDGNHLTLLCGGPSRDGMIRDAIGAAGNKKIHLYYDRIAPGQTLFISSEPVRNILEAEACMTDGATILAQADALPGCIDWIRRDGIIALVRGQERKDHGRNENKE